jgi:hypothetical protein
MNPGLQLKRLRGCFGRALNTNEAKVDIYNEPAGISRGSQRADLHGP